MADEIGRAKIVVEADTEGVKASISDAKEEIKSAGSAGEQAGNQIGGGFKSAGEKIEESTEGVRKFAGAISSTVGILTGLTGAFTVLISLATAFGRSMLTAAKETGIANQKFTDMQRSILELDPDKSGVFSKITSQVGAIEDAIFDANVSTEQQNYLLGLTAELRDRLDKQETARRYNEERDAARAAAKELDAYAESIERAVLAQGSPAELAEREFDDTVRRLEELNNARGFGFAERASMKENLSVALKNAELLRDAKLAHIKEEEAAKREAENKAAAAEDKAHQDKLLRIQKEADAFADALDKALSGIADSLFGTGGNNLTTRLDTLVSELRQIKDDMGALR